MGDLFIPRESLRINVQRSPHTLRNGLGSYAAPIGAMSAVLAIGFWIAWSSPRDFVRATQPFDNETVGELLPGRPVSQEFVATSDGLNGVEILLGTYSRLNRCTVTFSLVDVQSTTDVVSRGVSAADIIDHDFALFSFPPIANSARRVYRLTLESPDASPGQAITAYDATWGTDNEGRLSIGNVRRTGSLTFKTHYSAPSMAESYLDQLTAYKPGIWGQRYVYILLAIAYLVSNAALLTAIHRRDLRLAVVLLALFAILQSTVYLAIILPWEVPDEPEHFAYVRQLWLESGGRHPGVAESDVLQSMARHAWYQINNMSPPPRQPTEFRDVPFLQLSDKKRETQPGLYYQLSTTAINLSAQTDVDGQLYVVRLLSAALAVGVVMIGYISARLLFPAEQAVAIAAIVALVPERAFIAAGVNNDNLAILVASAMFLVSVRILAAGLSPWRLLEAVSTGALIPLSKSTALEGAIAPVVAIFAVLLRGRTSAWPGRRIVGLALAVLTVGIGTIYMSVGQSDAYAWSANGTSTGNRSDVAGPAGAHALEVRNDLGAGYASLYQLLPTNQVPDLRGQPMTFGTWFRGVGPPHTGYIQFVDDTTWHTLSFTATDDWQFQSSLVIVDQNATQLFIHLVPNDPNTAGGTVMFSGVIAVPGDFSRAGPPQIADGGRKVDWGGKSLANLVTNGTAETPLLKWRGPLGTAVNGIGIPSPLPALQEIIYPINGRQISSTSYADYFSTFIDSFWARFGWMNVPLPSFLYILLESLTVLSLVAGCGSIIRMHILGSGASLISIQGATLSLVVVIVGFTIALLRGAPGLELTQGRYALPVVVPFAVILWLAVANLSPAWSHRYIAFVFVTEFLLLNLVSLMLAIVPASYGW